jgi:carbon storage regulator
MEYFIMLVLTRKNNEQIIITIPNEKEIVIRVVQISSNQVKIGIDAPKEFLILRDELIDTNNLL